MMMALWVAAFGVARLQGIDTPDLIVWDIVLLVQSIPYAAAVFMSLVGGFSKLPKKIINNMTLPASSVIEHEKGTEADKKVTQERL